MTVTVACNATNTYVKDVSPHAPQIFTT